MKAFTYLYLVALAALLVGYSLYSGGEKGEGTDGLSTLDSPVQNNVTPQSKDAAYFQEVIDLYKEAEKLVGDNRFYAAYLRHIKAEEIYNRSNLYNLNIDGKKALDIYKEIRENFLLKVKARESELFDSYANLEINNDAINSFRSIRYDLFKEVSDNFYKVKQARMSERLAKATKTLMLKFTSGEKYFSHLIYDSLESGLSRDSPVKIGIGPPEQGKEADILWKLMEVQVTELEKDYNQIVSNYGGRQTSYQTSGYKLPVGVQVRILPISGKVATSWDSVITIKVMIDSPDSIKLDNNDSNQMAELAGKFRAELSLKLLKELKNIKPFEIYPGIKINADPIEGDKLNKELLSAVYYKDPQQFRTVTDKIKNSESSQLKAGLCRFIADYKLESEADWLAEEMFNQNDAVRKEIIELLKPLISIGNYKVALAIAASLDDTGPFYTLLGNFSRDSSDNEARLFELIKQTDRVKSNNRIKLTSVLMNSLTYKRESNPDMRLYSALANDPEIKVAEAYLRTCSEKAPDLHAEVFGKVYSRSDEKQKKSLILAMKMQAPYSQAQLDLLKKLAGQETSDDLLNRIIYKIIGTAKSLEGWNLLREVCSFKSVKENKDAIYRAEQALVYSACDALKSEALDYLSSTMKKEIQLGFTMTEILKTEDGMSKGFDEIILNFPSLSPKGQQTACSVLARAAKRRNTDYSSPSFFKFVELLKGDDKPEVRTYAYQLMAASTQKKWRDYSVALKESLEKETDEKIKQQLTELIKGL